MNTIIRNEIKNVKNKLLEFLSLTLESSKKARKALKDNDVELATECLDYVEIGRIKTEELVDDLMYIITQSPLAKNLRRVISYISITRIIQKIINNTTKIAQFTIGSKQKPSRSSINRINKVDKIFEETMQSLINEFNKSNNKTADLMRVIEKYSLVKDAVKVIRKELNTSISKRSNINSIAERMWTLSIAESIERNVEKIVSICEYILFVSNGKNYSFVK